MRPSFNVAGPCIPGEHYMLPPERRLGRVLEFIEDGKYFTIHAGRQVGKTTSARWLVDHFNAGSKYRAIWVDLQVATDQPNPSKAFRTVLGCMRLACTRLGMRPAVLEKQRFEQLLEDPSLALNHCLTELVQSDSRPWVVLFDEADGLVGETMVSFLKQLRQGYLDRTTTPFPWSIVLIGQRQVRDFVLRKKDRRALAWLGTSSPFNVTTEAMTLDAFAEPEIGELLEQHTRQTGQRFEPDAVARIYELGQGHPWLTNALADQITYTDVRDRSIPITAEHVEAAKETIIVQRRSHIDTLIDYLHDERVRKILDPMLAGDTTGIDVLDSDFAYARGLGLIRIRAGKHEIANPIYREVIPRALTFIRQTQIVNEPEWYVRKDGSLDMRKLMVDWQDFWRIDGHLAMQGFVYRESGPHLMLMAFLQRIVNGGVRIVREYGLGRRALDLMVFWKNERHAIELKLRRDTETETRALQQLTDYLDRAELREGWLVFFDLRSTLSWDERLTLRDVEHSGKTVHIVGC